MRDWFIQFWEQRGDAILSGAWQIALVMGTVYVVRWLGSRFIAIAVKALTQKIEVSERRTAQIKTISSLLNSALYYATGFVGILTILGILGINLGPVLATAGISGLAISLGAQQVVRDVITGFFIIVEDQFAVGEYVTIDGVTGTIETMGMRITRIRDDEGRLITISNSSIARVVNHSRGARKISLEVALNATMPLAEARAWLERICAQFDHPDLRSPLSVHGPMNLESSRYLFRVDGFTTPSQSQTVLDTLRAYLLTQAQAESVPLA